MRSLSHQGNRGHPYEGYGVQYSLLSVEHLMPSFETLADIFMSVKIWTNF